MSIIVTLALFATIVALISSMRGADDHPPAPAYVPGDMPNRLPQPGARDRYSVSPTLLGRARVPRWG